MEFDVTSGKPMPKFAPLCIWCSAPWSDENVKLELEACSSGCESGGYDSWAEGVVSIVCHACKREMYRKEGSTDPW